MSMLLGEGADTTPLAIYRDDQPTHDVNGLAIAPRSGYAGSRSLEALKIAIEVDRDKPPFARHRGEEWVFVLSGVLRLEYDTAMHLLTPGQSAHFDADRPHRLGAEGGPTEVLLVVAETLNDLRQAHQYSEPGS
jgi:mannose-6-phosphate isomerase-like protein (cupin superfamily)